MKQKKIDFDNNKTLLSVVGAHDVHLKKMSSLLGIDMKHKGNQIILSGDNALFPRAEKVLTALYDQAAVSGDITDSELEAVVRTNGENFSKDLTLRTKKKHISPRSARQGAYIDLMNKYEMVFGLGPAGTGKTFLAVAKAITMMLDGEVDKIILSRPAVEAGENLGFLPGDLKEKIDPYLQPLYDALYEMMPNEWVDKRIETGEIEIAPLAFMRGRTLSRAFVILDEAQNTTTMQMKMFLTRLGEGSRMVVNGDLSQTDLPRGQMSGLEDAVHLLDGVKGIASLTFTEEDVVRHGLVAKIIKAYEAKAKRY